MAIPTLKAQTLLQPVPGMLRNSLLTIGPRLKDLDFNHLQMIVPVLDQTADTVKCQLIVKPSSTSRYKLESKQVFTFTRVDANEGLTLLGLTERTFSKKDYAKVVEFLEDVGTLTTVQGDVTNPKGNATVAFVFGDRFNTKSPARFIELGSNEKKKSHYNIAFKGVVKFTFEGEATVEPDVPANPEAEGYVDISPLFITKSLNDLTGTLLR